MCWYSLSAIIILEVLSRTTNRIYESMTVKEIRMLTGLSQAEFGNRYGIPVNTIKNWEAHSDSKNHRECPPYVNQLLERVVRYEYHLL